ncbi:MAG: YfiR family protein [Marinilabiliaceae bacterium]|nr:YfiR family protein [Marinilabiliaceae bacterium]
MAKFQALYIYNFAKNIGWASEDNSKDFVITVVGDNELVSELNSLAKTKKIGNRTVIVKEAATVNGLPKSDIIYLGESKSAQIASLMTNQKGNKTLIVTGRQGQCADGAGISFFSQGSKLNFEISEKNIKTGGLNVSAKLLQLGTQVD